MKKITYYHKDHCRIYWRIECSLNLENDTWDFEIFRSLDDFDDKNAASVYSGDIPISGDEENPDSLALINQFARYQTTVFIGMAQGWEDFAPEINMNN